MVVDMRRGLIAGMCALAIGCGNKRAAPKGEAPQPPAEQRHRVFSTEPPAAYVAALRDGRARAVAGDVAAAMAAYEAALKIVADDVPTRIELSRLALQAGDAVRARDEASAAAARALNPRLRAAALHQLGAAARALGDDDRARAVLTRSLAWFPTAAVGDLVAALVDDDFDPLAPVPMRGPVDDLNASCGLVPELAPATPCVVHAGKSLELGAPYLGVQAFRYGGQEASGPCNLAIRTDAGWFVAGAVVDCGGGVAGSTELEILSAITQRERPPVIRLVQFAMRESQSVEDIVRVVVLCGLGPSGVPSCTPSIPVYASYTAWDPLNERSGVDTQELTTQYTLDVAGTLALSGDGGHNRTISLRFP